MPIPFLVPIAIAAASATAAATGVGAGANAIHKNKKAQNMNAHSQATFDLAKEAAETARERSNKSLEKLGKIKLDILDQSIERFISSFQKIHNIKLKESTGLNELRKFCLDEQSMIEMREMSSMASSVLGGLIGGAGAGALTAFGAYGATMTFAAASTGTAIASLSGAAATNATLAFLGGGALAAGGGGMALGSAVLGGAVAGPAIAILGIVMNASASKNLDNAYSNEAKTQEAVEGLKIIETLCDAITARSIMFYELLDKLNHYFEGLINQLEELLHNSGNDYSKYTEEEQAVVAMALNVAGAIKQVLDTPILDKDGNLTTESNTVHQEINEFANQTCKSNNTEQSKSSQTNFKRIDDETKIAYKQVRKLIESFLSSDSVNGKLKNEFDRQTSRKLLRIFQTSGHKETIDDIIGLYDPSAMHCLTDDHSGILFTRQQLYYMKSKKDYSIPIRYQNIRAVEEKFSSLIIYLRNGNPITFKGIMFSTSELVRLLTGISEIFEQNSNN